jgi:ABC-type nitrate/sulfonate/bicarbonate transport system substrate-binding protein
MWIFIFSALIIVASGSHARSAEKLDRIRTGYSSISSSRIALWAAADMGFFRKNNLAAEVIVTPGIQGTQALMAGELQILAASIRRRWRLLADRTWSHWRRRSRLNTS